MRGILALAALGRAAMEYEFRPLYYPLHCLLHYSLRSALETPPALPSALPPARAVPDPFCNAPSTTFFHHPLRPPPYNVVTGSLTPSAA